MSRKSALAALKELSRKKIVTVDDYAQAVEGLNEADDRSFALVWAAMVEFALETALLRSMETLSRTDESAIFTGFGPLSTFI